MSRELPFATDHALTVPHPVVLDDLRLARLLVASSSSSARQSHGFVFQSGVASLLSLYVPFGYTDEVDAYSIKQPLDEVMRHSFKNMKARSAVELGSLSRNASVPRDFAMYVGFWDDFGTNVRRVYVLHVRADLWRGLFPSNWSDFEKDAAFRDAAGEITNARSDDARWEARQAELKRAWAAAVPQGSPIAVAFKRDHKKQRRVQCGVPFSAFDQLFCQLYDPLRTFQLEQALDGLRVPEV